MRVAIEVRPGEQGTVDDAGMVEPIGEDRIPPPHQRGDDAGVRSIARVEQKRSLGSLEAGQAHLQLLVEFHGTGNQPGGAAAGPQLGSLDCGRFQRGVVGKPQVVVGAQKQDRPAVEFHPTPHGALYHPHAPVQPLSAKLFQFFRKTLHVASSDCPANNGGNPEVTFLTQAPPLVNRGEPRG